MKKLLLAFIAVFALAGCSSSAADRLDQTFETDVFTVSYDSTNFVVSEDEMKLYDYELVINSNDQNSFMAMWSFDQSDLDAEGVTLEEFAQAVVADSLEDYDASTDKVKKTTFSGIEAYRYSGTFAEIIALINNDRVFVIMGGSVGDSSKADLKTIKATIESLEFK